MSKLYIYKDQEEIGELFFVSEEESLKLNYSETWIEHGFPLSPHLGFDQKFSSGSLKRFLENLFPEGQNLSEFLEQYRISKSHTFRILQIIGSETTGALSFQDQKEKKVVTSFRLVEPSELTSKLDEKQHHNLFTWDGKPRLSIAGVQDKLPMLLLPDGRMGFGEGDLASTHIFKFERQKEQVPHLVLNEYFCMKLAKHLKLPVANVDIRKFGNHWTLMVERFDRKWTGEKVQRLHIIDGCQALDLPGAYKYERNFGSGRDVAHIRDGVTLKALFDFCNQCRVPAKAVMTTIDWLVYNLCISNSDAHGKNISYFVSEKGIHPAPFYDLVNIAVYPSIDHDLALSIGEEFSLNQIKGFQLAQMCEVTGISRKILSNQIKKITKEILAAIDEVHIPEVLTPEELHFIRDLKENIIQRTQHFMNCAPEIPRL